MADTPVPDGDAIRALAADLGDRSNALAAEGRVADVPALWETAIAGLPHEAARARITLAYAWYQALHGEVDQGVRLAAGLRECSVPQVRGQIRVLVRNRMRVEAEVPVVERAWRAVAGSELPEWAHVRDEDVDLVAEWVSAASWEESQALFDSTVTALRSPAVEYVLEELALGDGRLLLVVAVHRAILELGGEVGYRSVSGSREAAAVAAAAIEAGDWDVLRAAATIERKLHGQAFLGGVHGVAADLMTGGDLEASPELADRVAELAQDAEPWERRQAAADLAAVGDDRVGALAALIAGISGTPATPAIS